MTDTAGEVGPETLLRGVQYALEMINFTMFIAEEAEQTAISGCNMAIQNGSLFLAQRMSDEVMGLGSAKIWEVIVLYGIGFSPAWPAFYCYMLLTRHYITYIQGNLAAAWANKGIYTRKQMETYGGTTTTWMETHDAEGMQENVLTNLMNRLEDEVGDEADYFRKTIEDNIK